MRGKGINYDTGFYPGGMLSRPDFDPDIVRREMQVISAELGCTAVRITGADPERMSIAGEQAAAAGLEVWISPFPCELTTAQMTPLFADCADRAAHLRRSGANVVLVTGCELSLFAAGFIPGATVFERIAAIQSGGPQVYAAYAAMPERLNSFLAATAATVRERFGGPVTYASGMWEPVDWAPFDMAATDAYRDASNAARFREELLARRAPGKPLVVTEFGCCSYQGAAERGGMGWAIVEDTEPPRLNGEYIRDESEPVGYLRELSEIFQAEGVDLAFWFTFAGYGYPHDPDPGHDLDMASYGLVKMLKGGPPAGYQGLGWEPKLAFTALAGHG
jgi:hypothetical protein